MSPRTQSQNPCILVYLLSTKMEVVERCGRQEGAPTLSTLGDFGVPGNGKAHPTLWSLKEFHMPTPHRSVHTSPHTQTHTCMEAINIFRTKDSPSPIPQVGVPPKGEELSARFFKGGKGKARLCLHSLVGNFIMGFLLEERVGGNQLFFCTLQAAPSQVEAKSGAVSLKQNLMIVLRY